MGVSRRRYASMRGVSDMAVRKAIASGRISVEADGTIDPLKADAQWDSQTDPAKQRGVLAQNLGARTAAGTARAAATNWLVDHVVLAGDTAREEVWADLSDFLSETWDHAGNDHARAFL
ncbi:terminase gpA endonuclease subunit [Plastorhodobacter daqingensis]|uniref:Terminase gpA endonuclease subunit n=1 Tax=Plastorhodobacter daqingensis TaxID=1387281 RepID=A0ABW2UQW9_9RHOB